MGVLEDFDDWLSSLCEQDRREALGVRGEVPRWMEHSMHEAGLVLVRAELTDGHPDHSGYLLPTVIRDHLEGAAS